MKILRILPLILLIAACGTENKKSEEEAFIESLDSVENTGPSIDENVIGEIIQQVPSPLEISVLLKQSGTKYDKSLLNSTDNISNYNSNFKKAVNLGIYGTDLGYTNIYEKNQDGLDYMSGIKTLADGLNIGQFFELETIAKLATNSKNLDSLLLITTQNFNSINQYLQEQSRSHLSILLLTGGWIEAMHITCQVSAKDPTNIELQEKIGEQKIILENIRLLISFYKDSDPKMAELLSEIEKLEKVFNEVEITQTYKESTFEIVDGVMMIKDNSESHIEITSENVENIMRVTSEVRTKLIN